MIYFDPTIKAASLYQSIMQIHNASLEEGWSFSDFIILYVPKMLYYHRTIWTEETLFFLHQKEGFDDYLQICEPTRQKLIMSYNNLPINKVIEHYIANLFGIEDISVSNIVPVYYVIENNLFSRALNLLAFS